MPSLCRPVAVAAASHSAHHKHSSSAVHTPLNKAVAVSHADEAFSAPVVPDLVGVRLLPAYAPERLP